MLDLNLHTKLSTIFDDKETNQNKNCSIVNIAIGQTDLNRNVTGEKKPMG